MTATLPNHMLSVELEVDEIVRLCGHSGPAVAIVTRGRGTLASLGQDSVSVAEGSIFYIAPGTPTVWHAEEALQVYAAVMSE